jgi:hypothetical protein
MSVFVHKVSNSQSHNYRLNIALDPHSKQKNCIGAILIVCTPNYYYPLKVGCLAPPISKHLIFPKAILYH